MEINPNGASHQVVTQLMFIDSKIFHSLQALTDKLWKEKREKFFKATGVIVNQSDSQEEWISLLKSRCLTDHSFYHLMAIKQSLFNPFN